MNVSPGSLSCRLTIPIDTVSHCLTKGPREVSIIRYKEREVGKKRAQRKEGKTDEYLSAVRYDSKNFKGTVLLHFPNPLRRCLLFSPILQMRKLRCRKVKWLDQCNTARKFWRQDSHLNLADIKVPGPLTSTLWEGRRGAGNQEGGDGWTALGKGGGGEIWKTSTCNIATTPDRQKPQTTSLLCLSTSSDMWTLQATVQAKTNKHR